MQRCRWYSLVAPLALSSTVPVFAQNPVDVAVSPDRVTPGQTVAVTIEINVPVAPPNRPDPSRASPYLPGEAPIFGVSAPFAGPAPGALIPGEVVNGEWLIIRSDINPGDNQGPIIDIRIRTNPQLEETGWRARTTARLTYQVSADAPSGEVTIAVEGKQGSAVSGGALTTFRGSARLFITSRPGGGISGPATKPPFTPTGGAVNPTADIIKILAGIAAVLAALGTVKRINSRSSKPRSQNPADGLPQLPVAARLPAEQKPKDKPQTPEAGYDLYVRLKPTEPIVVVADHESTPATYPYRGDGADLIELAVVLVPAKEWVGEFLPFISPKNARGNSPYGNWVHDPDASWYDRPPGSEVQYFRLAVPWEWTDKTVAVVSPRVKFTLTHLASATQKTYSRVGPSTDPVTILGANPRIFIAAEPIEVLATGRNYTTLTPTLWLFFEPAERETLVITRVKGIKGDERKEQSQIQNGRLWFPPFLLQDPKNVEVVPLEASCLWEGGELWQRAPDSRRKEPIEAQNCEVHLRGCTGRLTSDGNARTEFFCPLPDTPLFATAQLLNANNEPIRNPLSAQAVHSSRAKIRCEVRDLSQGPRTKDKYGCTLPPKLLIEGTPTSFPDAARAALSRAPLVNKPTVDVDPVGRLYTQEKEGTISSFTVVQEEAGPPGPHTQRIDRGDPKFLLWRYALRAGCDPIHDGPVVYTVFIEDGFGGELELQGVCRAALGSLVLETGGEDFRIYEYRPYSFEVGYEAGEHGYRPAIEHDTKVTLAWEFAFVDAGGQPAAPPVGSVTTEGDIASGKFHLIVGHTPKERAIYINRQDGEVRFVRPDKRNADGEFPPRMWRKVQDHERSLSFGLRSEWHDLAYVQEPALQWLPIPGEGTSTPQPWRDRALSLAVRIEMRNHAGHLLATSDRLTDKVGRTPSEFVWRDHRFRYVLLALRLLLRDESNQSYANRRYRLEFGGKNVYSGQTSEHGALQEWPPVGADFATLHVLDGNNKPCCTFELKLGYLDPADEVSGAQARLNNLGNFAGEQTTGIADERYQRALQRFQTLYDMEVNGSLDFETARKLEKIHVVGSD